MIKQATTDTSTADYCTLDKNCRAERLRFIRDEITPQVLNIRDIEHGIAVEFSDNSDIRTKLEKLQALESQCCASLGWELYESNSLIVLQITGVNVDVIRRELSKTSVANTDSKARRITKTGGLSLAIAAVICCAIPIGLVLIFGSALAAPFLFLESPKWILLMTVLIAVPVWIYLGRRKRSIRQTN